MPKGSMLTASLLRCFRFSHAQLACSTDRPKLSAAYRCLPLSAESKLLMSTGSDKYCYYHELLLNMVRVLVKQMKQDDDNDDSENNVANINNDTTSSNAR